MKLFPLWESHKVPSLAKLSMFFSFPSCVHENPQKLWLIELADPWYQIVQEWSGRHAESCSCAVLVPAPGPRLSQHLERSKWPSHRPTVPPPLTTRLSRRTGSHYSCIVSPSESHERLYQSCSDSDSSFCHCQWPRVLPRFPTQVNISDHASKGAERE